MQDLDYRKEHEAEIRKMRNAAIQLLTHRRFSDAMACINDLESFLAARNVSEHFFKNLCDEILITAREMSQHPKLIDDFADYINKKSPV